MITQKYPHKNNGFTLLGALVALIAVVAGLLLVAQLTGILNVGEKRLDNVVAAEQVLALTARMVLEETLDTTTANCNSPATPGNNVAPSGGTAVWNCVGADHKLNFGTITASSTKKFLSRLNEKAEADANGKFCIELTHCEKKAADHILDITITAFYPDPTEQGAAHQKIMKFRKSKW